MRYELVSPGPSMMLKVQLDYGESLKAEAGAMIAMSDTVDVEGKVDGGVLKGLGRMLAGESFFFQTLTARRGPGEVLLAHELPGEIHPLTLDGQTNYILQKDGFFAASRDVEISTKVQNLLKGLFSGEGFFVLRASGMGTLFVSSYGAIYPIDLADGQEIIIDNGHLVAWPETMDYKIQKASSGWIS
ncbi:MAG: TIGR00266 family protein, partial [Gemmataceae bacterium]|nr:TIGR00266 family protein [Gemmataceae bacterium]